MRVLCILVFVLFSQAAQATHTNPWLDRYVLNMAHRGGRAEAPEHTMYAYRTALPKGVNVLEIDVQLSSDGFLVIHHDSTVDRVTEGSGAVSSLTLAELKALDNAYDFDPSNSFPFRGVATGMVAPPPGFSAEDFQILTLREVLEAFPSILMSIEVKGSAPASVPAAEATADILLEFGRLTDVLIASFDDATIAAFKAAAPEIHTTPGQDQLLAWVLSPGPLPEHAAFQIPRTFNGVVVAIEPIITLAHNNDLPVYVFIDPGEETPVIYNELIDAGVDGIITDRPRDLQAVLVARGVVWAPGIPGIPALPPLVLLALGVGIVLGGAWATRRARDNSLRSGSIRSNSCVEA